MHLLHMLYSTPTHDILTPLHMEYRKPFYGIMNPSFGRNEGFQFYHDGVQYTMTKFGLRGRNTIWYLKLLLP
jgi:hypothetical protein